jgi:hypothetical protein
MPATEDHDGASDLQIIAIRSKSGELLCIRRWVKGWVVADAGTEASLAAQVRQHEER